MMSSRFMPSKYSSTAALALLAAHRKKAIDWRIYPVYIEMSMQDEPRLEIRNEALVIRKGHYECHHQA
jgi:hypothetical protein